MAKKKARKPVPSATTRGVGRKRPKQASGASIRTDADKKK